MDCGRNSSRQPVAAAASSVSVSISVSRKVALARPTLPTPTSSHGRSAVTSMPNLSGFASKRPLVSDPPVGRPVPG
jgi:hypothetical protein